MEKVLAVDTSGKGMSVVITEVKNNAELMLGAWTPEIIHITWL
jgi:hypothetical protein